MGLRAEPRFRSATPVAANTRRRVSGEVRPGDQRDTTTPLARLEGQGSVLVGGLSVTQPAIKHRGCRRRRDVNCSGDRPALPVPERSADLQSDASVAPPKESPYIGVGPSVASISRNNPRSFRQQGQSLVVIHRFPRDKFFGKHIYSSKEGQIEEKSHKIQVPED